jgi:hypothetical protein
MRPGDSSLSSFSAYAPRSWLVYVLANPSRIDENSFISHWTTQVVNLLHISSQFKMDLIPIPSTTILLAGAIFLLALYVAYIRSSTNKPLQKFHAFTPHVGKHSGIFSSTRATLHSFTNTASLVANGYAEYSSQNIPFLVSNFRKGPILVIPPASLKAVLNTPEHVVASLHPQADSISAKYTMRDQAIYPANTDVDVVRKQITKRFGSLCQDLADEVGSAFGEIWGVGDEWKEFEIWPALEEVAARIVNRVIVGLPLCESPQTRIAVRKIWH